jgi:hypothetical protein
MQLFDMKTKYQFQTAPGVDQYNMPLYNVQQESTDSTPQNIGMYPVYQGFTSPAYINGVEVPLETLKKPFFTLFPNVIQNLTGVAVGNGGATYPINIPLLSPNTPISPLNPPVQAILRGHVDMSGIIATGNNQDPPFGTTLNTNILSTSIYPAVYITTNDAYGNNVTVQDSGQFLIDGSGNNQANYGLLMTPGNAPYITAANALPGGYSLTSNTVNYVTGVINVTFPTNIPQGQEIAVQVLFFQTGLPRSILFYNNTLTLRSPPDKQYLIELDAYLTPAAFMTTAQALPFAYMAEYFARGAARKILSDTGDVEQFMFYEPLFKEQELLVWKRSQRQWTNNRTPTIYSAGMGTYGNFGGGAYGGGQV